MAKKPEDGEEPVHRESEARFQDQFRTREIYAGLRPYREKAMRA
jgi:hypothetical protein